MNGNVIRTITIKGTSEGLEKLTADVNKLAAAEQNVAGMSAKSGKSMEDLVVVTERSAKSVLSLEDAWKKQTLKLDEAARAQANYSREAKIADAVLRQNLISQQEHAARLDLIAQKYNQGSAAQKAFATATSGVSAQLVAMSAGAGPVGVFLSALGPWGMAAAVGLGAASSAFNYLIDGANHLGDKSIEVRKFAEVTGLTVTQIKALTSEGGKLGIGSDQITSGVEKFTVGLAEARKGTGALFEQVRAINPVLAQQLAATTNAAEGWDVLGQAMKATTDQSQKAALARAAFGRGGVEIGLLAGQTADAGGIVAMGTAIARNTGLTDEWVKKTAQLRAENLQLEKQIQTMKESVYAKEILQRQNDFLKTEKAITEEFLRRRSVMGRGGQGVGGDDDAAAAREAAANRLGGRRGREAGAIKAALDPAVIAGWQQLDDAIAAAADQSEVAARSLTKLQNESAAALNKERERIGLLGDAATEQERLNVKTLELNAALLANKISQEDFNRALAAQTTASDQMLKNLRQEGELIRADTQEERDRISARQTYQRLIDKTVDSTKAAAIASQQLSNANETRWRAEEKAADDAVKSIKSAEDAWRAYASGIISWSVANDEAGAAARRLKVEITGITQAIKNNNAALLEATKFIPFGTTWAGMSPTGLGTGDSQFKSNQGGLSQFNPQGYQSNTSQGQAALFAAAAAYGEGGFEKDSSNQFSNMFAQFVPNTQGLETQVNASMAAGSASAISGLLTGLTSANSSLVQSTAGILSRLTAMLPDDQKAGAIQQQLDALKGAPATLARSELVQQLNEQLKQLTEATQENTSATSTMTDVLSPYYSSDPRRTHLGFRAFAGGGIMSQFGELPIRHYQGGGMATSPQVAVFGEGSTPEAYVPVPSGRIPVEVKMPANANQKQRPVNVNIVVQGNADQNTVAALRATAFQQAQAMRRVMS